MEVGDSVDDGKSVTMHTKQKRRVHCHQLSEALCALLLERGLRQHDDPKAHREHHRRGHEFASGIL